MIAREVTAGLRRFDDYAGSVGWFMGHVNSMRTGSTAFEVLLYQEARRCIWTE
jgi:hypothetical protein